MNLEPITITIDKEELALIIAAMAYYRMAGFPLGKSSYGNPISCQDRREFAAFGMKVWEKLQATQNKSKGG